MAKQRQTLLFSATFNDNIWRLAKTLLKSPKVLELQASEQGGSIKERLIELDSERKAAAVAALCRRHDWRQVLLFSRTKEGADKLVCELSAEGLAASALHSDLGQAQREQTYQAFKAGECRLLVATDVAARGLDVAALPCVINLELPFKREDYVHRIGRTGRAGMEGSPSPYSVVTTSASSKSWKPCSTDASPENGCPGLSRISTAVLTHRETRVKPPKSNGPQESAW